MADTEQQDDELLLDDEIEEQDDEQETESTEVGADDDAPIVIEIEGEEPAAEQDSPVIRQMRDELRRTKRELAETRAQAAPQEIEVGNKPDLWDDCDGDPEAYDKAMDEWRGRKQSAEAQRKAKEEAAEQSTKLWNGIEDKYRQKAAALGVPDYEAKEQKVVAAIPDLVLRGVKAYCDDPAKVIAALGSNQSLLDKLADEQDPVKVIITLAKLEDKMTVTRKRQIEPDKALRGSAAISAAGADKQLEKLQQEAARTGDRTKLVAYKAQMQKKAN